MMEKKIQEYLYRRFRTSFAKSGEDILLYQLLKNEKFDLFVDVGAHHPKVHSNSYFFALRGWKGICIEPKPIFEKPWKKYRPDDLFLNIGVSPKSSFLDYFEFKHSERNTFSKKYIDENKLQNEIVSIKKIQTKTLNEIFIEQKLTNKKIGFLSIDTEGLDFDILS